MQPAELPCDAVEIGRVANAWGVKGWFKVQSYSADAQALLAAKLWYLQPAREGDTHTALTGTVQLPVREVRAHADGVVAWAQGVDGRDAAQALRGARVFVSRACFPATQGDEYYWVDLIGLAVINRQGVSLGTVRRLLPAGPQTTLVLAEDGEGSTHGERMIPFVGAFVDKVDLVARRITVDWQADY